MDTFQQIADHEQVKQEEERGSRILAKQNNNPRQVQRPQNEFEQLLFEYENIWDVHPGHTKMAKQRIKMTSKDIRLVHSAPYFEG